MITRIATASHIPLANRSTCADRCIGSHTNTHAAPGNVHQHAALQSSTRPGVCTNRIARSHTRSRTPQQQRCISISTCFAAFNASQHQREPSALQPQRSVRLSASAPAQQQLSSARVAAAAVQQPRLGVSAGTQRQRRSAVPFCSVSAASSWRQQLPWQVSAHARRTHSLSRS